ncbi:cytochrome d ubiquinol oxidase subunit II [Brachybacterium squillarum]|uniref:cytochrome d ubiquinol oxidase subunit II n=1 Tax=Brachybacterium squillarum TaxID=661979 RepID=UPI002223141C|nr:cytochrome d ubiquinol oxidase subunit II [Brachybacterium squillarum]MCW1805327.1 cytochrome d ubiquinol oxidase subunit II [Brachybacterium squillarum]
MDPLLAPTGLQIAWFALIALLFGVYFVLEGFDFGVQMNVGTLARDDHERHTLLSTIHPVWDGNQVWIITGAAAIFAAFPEWYATLFSGFYPVLLLLLFSLIVRVVAFTYRDARPGDAWRRAWDGIHVATGFLPPFLWGIVLGDVVAGVEIDQNRWVVTSAAGLLQPFALLTGVVLVLLFWLHGSHYLTLKLQGELRERARRRARLLMLPALLGGAALLLWYQLAYSHQSWTWAPLLVAALALVGTLLAQRGRREGLTLVGTGVAILAAAATLFGGLFPYVMPSTGLEGTGLTVAGSSSTPHTLTIMLVVTCILVPMILVYQSWAYWVFRHRLNEDGSTRATVKPLAARLAEGHRRAFEAE